MRRIINDNIFYKECSYEGARAEVIASTIINRTTVSCVKYSLVCNSVIEHTIGEYITDGHQWVSCEAINNIITYDQTGLKKPHELSSYIGDFGSKFYDVCGSRLLVWDSDLSPVNIGCVRDNNNKCGYSLASLYDFEKSIISFKSLDNETNIISYVADLKETDESGMAIDGELSLTWNLLEIIKPNLSNEFINSVKSIEPQFIHDTIWRTLNNSGLHKPLCECWYQLINDVRDYIIS